MIPTHTKKPTPVIAYKFEGLTSGSADYLKAVKILLDFSENKKAISYLESLISEPEVK